MNTRITIMLIVCSLFLISFASAIDLDYTFKQNTEKDLKRSCYLADGSPCPITSVCNITIVAPDQTTVMSNRKMGNASANYPNWNVTLTKSNNVQIGVYKADMSCFSGANNGSETFWYQVTPSGNDNSSLGMYIILIFIIYALVFLGAYFENIPLVMMSGMMMIILGLFTLNNGIDIYRNFATEAFSIFTIGIGAYFAITAGLKSIDV